MVCSSAVIGPEIVAASIEVLKAADARFNLDLTLDYESVGFESLHAHGTTLRQEVLEKSKTYDGVVLGTQSHADYPVCGQSEPQTSRAALIRVHVAASLAKSG